MEGKNAQTERQQCVVGVCGHNLTHRAEIRLTLGGQCDLRNTI